MKSHCILFTKPCLDIEKYHFYSNTKHYVMDVSSEECEFYVKSDRIFKLFNAEFIIC